MERLRSILLGFEGRNYKAYKELQGDTFEFERFSLIIDHVQGDPYAAPSRMRAVIPMAEAGIPEKALASKSRRRACRDFLARAFRAAARREPDLGIDAGTQTVLARSACLFVGDTIELRFTADMPGRGRRILGRHAAQLLCTALPHAVEHAALAANLDLAALEQHCAVVEDQDAMRSQLADRGLVAFVADGASLPRRSGKDDRPAREATLFKAPPSLKVTLRAPNAGEISGLGVRHGITLIVGGGFHGKSTLLKALENGIYDHVPGDGRERVVTEGSAVKIRAEDGRSVAGADISSFIG
ncbi:MAG: ABC-ATPase domain-containing protein, partial [Thermoanaerobaculales bacterium]|nr:ABC-ATPase domain-containing protein [Thermoanaerobaculales bacterium]